MIKKLKISPASMLGLFLAVLLFSSTAFVSAQQQTPTPTPAAAAQVTPTPTELPRPEPAIKVIIQESYIQERLEIELEDDPVFSNPVIDLQEPNLALISVSTRVNSFLVLRPTATVQFTIEDEEVVVEVLRLNVSGFNVPRSFVEDQIDELRQEIQDELNYLTGALTDADLVLTEISATDDALIVGLEPLTEEDENGEIDD
jgi:hypothetical protein